MGERIHRQYCNNCHVEKSLLLLSRKVQCCPHSLDLLNMLLNDVWMRLVHRIAGSSSEERLLYISWGAFIFWITLAVLFFLLSRKLPLYISALFAIVMSCSMQFFTLRDVEKSPRNFDSLQKLSVMTFNLRGAGLDSGVQSWEYRKHGIVAFLKQSAPAIVGTQEGSIAMLNHLSIASGYRTVNGESLPGQAGYSTLYNAEQVELIEATISFLHGEEKSPTHPKHCTVSLFRVKESKKTIRKEVKSDEAYANYVLHFNTHLDFVDERVRVRQATALRHLIADTYQRVLLSYPSYVNIQNVAVVVTGDFNTLRHSDTWNILLHGDGGNSVEYPVTLQDASLSAVKGVYGKTYFSFHGFHGRKIESLYFALPVAVACTALSLLSPSSSSSLCVPFSTDFHVDWILVGHGHLSSFATAGNTLTQTTGANNRRTGDEADPDRKAQFPVALTHRSMQTSMDQFRPAALLPTYSLDEIDMPWLQYLSDHYPVVVELGFP
jgi:endonuclease/exonuclease/phosphatase family metal-dependent hydrolase